MKTAAWKIFQAAVFISTYLIFKPVFTFDLNQNLLS